MKALLESPRRGTTMFEVLIMISISSVLMSLVAVWLHKLMFFSTVLLERQRDHAGLQRLAGELRQDVQLASSWSFPQTNELELVLSDDSKIIYRVAQTAEGFQIDAIYDPLQPDRSFASPSPGATRRQETYRFSPGTQLSWEKTEFPETLVLVAYRQPLLANPLPTANSVNAAPAAGSPELAAAPRSDSSHLSNSDDLDRPVEAVLLLKLNRWGGQIRRSSGETP